MMQVTCAECRYWHPATSVPRANATMGCCEHLSAYRSRTPFDYRCALFAADKSAEILSSPTSQQLECPKCGLSMYVYRREDGRCFCSNCALEWM